MTRLADIAGPWTADDQRRMDRFLKDAKMSHPNDCMTYRTEYTRRHPETGRLERMVLCGDCEIAHDEDELLDEWDASGTDDPCNECGQA